MLALNIVKTFSPLRTLSRTCSNVSNMGERDDLYAKISIEAKGHEPEVLRSMEIFVRRVADNLDLQMTSETRNRPIFDRLSLNKSPFIYKKHQRQYEFRTHYKIFQFSRLTGCTADAVLEYIERNTPEGVGLTVTKHKLEPLPEFLQEKLSATK